MKLHLNFKKKYFNKKLQFKNQLKKIHKKQRKFKNYKTLQMICKRITHSNKI